VRSAREIEKILAEDLQRATAHYREQSARFQQVIGDVPSGLPYPDGSLRVQQVSAAYKTASAELRSALNRYQMFFVQGIVPDDLQD
jgi:hypothetical protein